MKLHEQVKQLNKQVKDLEMQIEASEQRNKTLSDELAEADLTVEDLRTQVYHYQMMVLHLQAITSWKERVAA